MENISLYIKVVCLVSILSGVMTSMIPNGRLKSAYVSLTTVVLLSSMIVPTEEFKNSSFEFDFSDERTVSESLSEEMNEAEEIVYREIVSVSVEERLASKGINVAVTVGTFFVDGEITVTEVLVSGKVTQEEKAYISEFISDSFKKAKTVFKED